MNRSNDRGSAGEGLVTAAAVALCLILIGALILGGWWAGWWFKTQNTNREARLYQHQYGYQSSLREEVTNKLETVTNIGVQLTQTGDRQEQAALKAQRLSIAAIVCRDAAQIDQVDSLPLDQAQWVAHNCELGAVSPTSTLRH